MKRHWILVTLLISGVLVAKAQDFEARGFRIISTIRDGTAAVHVVRDRTGSEFSLSLTGPVSEGDLEILVAVREKLYQFESMKPASIRVAVSDRRADVIIVPETYLHKETNLLPYLPSGLQFIYTDHLEYDFRVVVDNLFVRMNGLFFTEDQFNDKLLNIIRNPAAYLQSQDPEYVFRTFRELQNQVGNLVGRIETLERALKDSDDRSLALRREFDLLRYGLLVLHNRGWFGGIDLPPPLGISRVLELKKANPGLTVREAEDRLRAEGIEMSGNEVFLVLGIYFNEFK